MLQFWKKNQCLEIIAFQKKQNVGLLNTHPNACRLRYLKKCILPLKIFSKLWESYKNKQRQITTALLKFLLNISLGSETREKIFTLTQYNCTVLTNPKHRTRITSIKKFESFTTTVFFFFDEMAQLIAKTQHLFILGA